MRNADSSSEVGSMDLPHRRIDRLLEAYGARHRNILNKLIHWLCLPVIFWCVLALLSILPFPGGWRVLPGLDGAAVAALLAIAFYAALSPALAGGMAVFSLLCLILVAIYKTTVELPLWQFALFVLAMAWALQFIGHKLERRKASGREDLQLLLIGPAWLMAKIYRATGLKY